jgi:hypothetical protein
MAEITFGATDKFRGLTGADIQNKPLYQRDLAAWNCLTVTSPNFGCLTKWLSRMQRLLWFAVYFSACAIIYICERAGVTNDATTVGRILDGFEPVDTEYVEPIAVPRDVPMGEVELYIELNAQSAPVEQIEATMNLMLVAACLVPTLAVLVIPGIALNASKSAEELAEKYEEQTILEKT